LAVFYLFIYLLGCFLFIYLFSWLILFIYLLGCFLFIYLAVLFIYLFIYSFFRFDSWRLDRANRRQNYNTLEVKQTPPPHSSSLYVLIAGKQFCLLNTGCIKLTHNEKPYLPATSSSFNISSPQLFHKF
jgi:hypothetical protein